VFETIYLVCVCVSELIDLCDEQGELKFLFVPQNSQKSACGLLKARESFTACIIKREFEFFIMFIDNLKIIVCVFLK